MAYNDDCGASGYNCTRIQYWSNPAVNYGGVATGIAEGNYHAADITKRSTTLPVPLLTLETIELQRCCFPEFLRCGLQWNHCGAASYVLAYPGVCGMKVGRVVHRITTYATGTITATLTNLSVDLDVFILGSCDSIDLHAYGTMRLLTRVLPRNVLYCS